MGVAWIFGITAEVFELLLRDRLYALKIIGITFHFSVKKCVDTYMASKMTIFGRVTGTDPVLEWHETWCGGHIDVLGDIVGVEA